VVINKNVKVVLKGFKIELLISDLYFYISTQESSHSSILAPSPSPSITSEEVDVKARQQEENDHYQRLQLYVFVVRCIAYPCTTNQPTDTAKREYKVLYVSDELLSNAWPVCS